MATAEDSDSPVAMKLKKMWLKTPVSEEQAAQAVLDPAIGNYFFFLYENYAWGFYEMLSRELKWDFEEKFDNDVGKFFNEDWSWNLRV